VSLFKNLRGYTGFKQGVILKFKICNTLLLICFHLLYRKIPSLESPVEASRVPPVPEVSPQEQRINIQKYMEMPRQQQRRQGYSTSRIITLE